jgi:hypothetical protein
VFSIHAELQALTAKLQAEDIPYALCGALALAVSARLLGFTLEASPMAFAAGKVQIRRLSKVIPGFEDVLMLDVLSLPAEIESAIPVEIVDWQGAFLRTVSREGLVRLKTLRGSAQDLADIEKLR